MDTFIGKKCIIRTYASGVHFGELVGQDGREVVLKDARRMWSWWAKSGISLSEVASVGIITEKSKICISVPMMKILDAIEIIPASAEAARIIEAAEVYQP